VIGDPRAIQRGIEAVAASAEVGLHGDGSQPRVDADEEQADVIAQQVGQCRAGEGFELCASEDSSAWLCHTITVLAAFGPRCRGSGIMFARGPEWQQEQRARDQAGG
jgi:hypothetical protein